MFEELDYLEYIIRSEEYSDDEYSLYLDCLQYGEKALRYKKYSKVVWHLRKKIRNYNENLEF